MIYRFKPSEKSYTQRPKKPFRRAGADSPKRLYGYRYDAIDIESLFELSKLEGSTKKQRKKAFALKKEVVLLAARISRAAKKCAAAIASVSARAYSLIKAGGCRLRALVLKAIEKRKARAKRDNPFDIPILAGGLCAVILVALLSAFTVLYALLLDDFFGRYEKVTVPDMVGRNYGVAIEDINDSHFDVSVSYKYSPTVAEGCVISQMPRGGVERKIFSDGSPAPLSLVVSKGKEMIEMGDLVASRARDAKLELKNAGFLVVERIEYSDTVAKGSVIATSPSAGKLLEAGGLAVLYVSGGPRVSSVRVPAVCGYDENSAVKRIISSGFSVGEVVYQSSDEKVGRVISQSPSYDQRAPKGSSVSIVISAGKGYSSRTVPSLYGLTLAEARARLAECGLVAGNVYATQSNEPSGRVISQSPRAGTSIDSSVVSVDMYISS